MPFLDPVNYQFDTSLSLESFDIHQFTICSNGHDMCSSMIANCLIDQNYLAAAFEEKLVILIPKESNTCFNSEDVSRTCRQIGERNHVQLSKDEVPLSPSILHLNECVKRWIVRKLCCVCHYQQSGEYLLSFAHWNVGSHSIPSCRSFCDALKLDTRFQYDDSHLTFLLFCTPVVFRFIPCGTSSSEAIFLPTHQFYSIDQVMTTTQIPLTPLEINNKQRGFDSYLATTKEQTISYYLNYYNWTCDEIGTEWCLISQSYQSGQYVPSTLLALTMNMSYSITMENSQRILRSITSQIPSILPCISTHSQLVHTPTSYISAKTLISNPSSHRIQCEEPKPYIKLQIPKKSSQKSVKQVPTPQQATVAEPQPTPSRIDPPQKRVKMNPIVQEVIVDTNTSVIGTKIPDLVRENKLDTATIPELKAYLKSKNQKVSGKKSDLVARVLSLLV